MLDQTTINNWLAKISSTDVRIWVENPETIKVSGLMGKSYTTFRVLLKASDGELVGIRHRYSEFETLRNTLKSRYNTYGIVVPALPRKKIIGALDKDFINERMQGLSLFCEDIVMNPWLRSDKTWKDFMCSTSTIPVSKVEDNPSFAEDMLFGMLDSLCVPSSPLERVCILKDELNHIEKQLKVILESSRQMQAVMTNFTSASESMQQGISSWSATENNLVEYLNGKTIEVDQNRLLSEHCRVPTMLARAAIMSAEKYVSTSHISDCIGILTSVAIEHEQARVDSLRELIKTHDDLLSSIDSLRVKMEKLQQHEASKWDQLQEARKQLDMKTQNLNAFYKGFFYFSLPMSTKMRAQNIRRALSASGATMMVTSHLLYKTSERFLADLKINAASAIADASQVLDTLALKPLDAIEHMAAGETTPTPRCCVDVLYKLAYSLSTGSSLPSVDDSELDASRIYIGEMVSEASPPKQESAPAPAPVVQVPIVDEPPKEQAPPIPKLQTTPKTASLLNDLTGGSSSPKEKDSDLWG